MRAATDRPGLRLSLAVCAPSEHREMVNGWLESVGAFDFPAQRFDRLVGKFDDRAAPGTDKMVMRHRFDDLEMPHPSAEVGL